MINRIYRYIIKHFTLLERAVLAQLIMVFVFSYCALRLHHTAYHHIYEILISEDGIVESSTVIAFIGAVFTAVFYLIRKNNKKQTAFFLTAIILVSLFVIGEEVSWGQRIFGFHTPEFFSQYNDQNETTLHNLVIAGIKVNIIIFSDLLYILVYLYFLLPFMCRLFPSLAEAMSRMGLFVPRPYIFWIALFVWVLSEMHPHGKVWELCEMTIAWLLVLILLRPSNAKGLKLITA